MTKGVADCEQEEFLCIDMHNTTHHSGCITHIHMYVPLINLIVLQYFLDKQLVDKGRRLSFHKTVAKNIRVHHAHAQSQPVNDALATIVACHDWHSPTPHRHRNHWVLDRDSDRKRRRRGCGAR